MSFAKLDSGIVNSTLWVQPDDVLRVWIWFLSQADAQGMVRTAAPALALVCMKPVDRVREILTLLESPDPDSRSEVEDGRRIRKVPGGWQIINYPAYRARISADEKRENDRLRIAEKRAAARDEKSQHVEMCSDVSQPVADVANVVNVAQAEVEVEEEVEAKDQERVPRKRGRSPRLPMPAGFGVSDRVRRWAEEKGHTRLDQHLESFVSKARKHGYAYADWDEAFMEAIRANWANLPATTAIPAAATVIAKSRAKKVSDPAFAANAMQTAIDELHGRRT